MNFIIIKTERLEGYEGLKGKKGDLEKISSRKRPRAKARVSAGEGPRPGPSRLMAASSSSLPSGVCWAHPHPASHTATHTSPETSITSSELRGWEQSDSLRHTALPSDREEAPRRPCSTPVTSVYTVTKNTDLSSAIRTEQPRQSRTSRGHSDPQDPKIQFLLLSGVPWVGLWSEGCGR